MLERKLRAWLLLGLWVWCWLLFGALLFGAIACSSQVVCRPDGITGAERCEQAGGAGDALVTGGAAAGIWAAAGCTFNGCEPPFRCNAKTKLCERLTCSETSSCPPGYQCADQACR
jgi:hypothetical protein